VLAGPFAAIVIAKALRRRRRRRQDRPADAIAGGGTSTSMRGRRRSPPATGRHAFRDRTGARASGGGALARTADEAVFSARPMAPDEADEFWRIVEDERAALATSRWRRLRAAVSLRSFVPRSFRSHFERGSRAASRPRRTA
jgi:hypothetical protein